MTETIAQTLGAKNGLAEHIAERELLLVLDNVEQVIDAAPEVARLLEACRNLKVLVTSRELLRVAGEMPYAVPPLVESDAVRLFCERSRLEPDEAIGQLCRRLDHLPLAVELAAARARVLTPAQILDRLDQRLDLFIGGRDADPRRQPCGRRSSGPMSCLRELSSGSSPALPCSPEVAPSKPSKRSPVATSTRCSRSWTRAWCARPVRASGCSRPSVSWPTRSWAHQETCTSSVEGMSVGSWLWPSVRAPS